MDVSDRRSWILAMIPVALAYMTIGIVFAALAKSADADHVGPWRLAAWVASAVVYAAHIWNEHRVASPPRPAALHVAAAVTLGAFGLALAANIHSLSIATHSQHSLLLALVAWPAITALPAFLAALVVAGVLARFARRA